MAETILPTGTGETYDTHVEALAVIPADVAVGDPYVIQHRVAETVAALTLTKSNANDAPHRWEATGVARHDGETGTGVVVSGDTATSAVTTNDWIVQDLHFEQTVNNRGWITATDAGSVRTTIRRCTFEGTNGSVGNGVFVTRVGSSVWFCTAAATASTTGNLYNVNNDAILMFCAAYVAAGSANAGLGIAVDSAPDVHGSISLDADGGTTTEWYGTPTVASYNVAEGEVAPGTDPVDLTDDLGVGFIGVYKSSDGTNWGIVDSYMDIAAAAYGGIDITGKPGYEAKDIYGNTFDPTNMVDGPRQPVVVSGTPSKIHKGAEQAPISAKQTLLDDLYSWALGAGAHGAIRLMFDTGKTTDQFIARPPVELVAVDWSAIDMNPADGADHAASLASLQTMVDDAL